MAGIGFQLRKLMSEGGYAGGLKAYGYSAVITSGPFLMTALSFLLTQLVSGSILTPGEQAYLQSLVTHAFALSLLTTGTLNFAVTRFAADEHYRRDVSRFAASFFSSVTASALAGGPLALLFVSGLKASWPVRLDFLLLYLFSSGAWLAMIFLSAAKRYKSIVTAFLAGTAAGFACSAFLGRHQGLVGYFAGFALGQGLTLLLLAETLLREFGYKQARGWAWLGTLREHPLLVGVGFFYHLGIWVDKLVFRFSPHREVLDRGLYSCPVYDTPLFYAYLTILPTLGYFLIQTETEFFEKYRAYYLGIQNRENLASLESRRGEMVATLARSLKKLLWAQGALSALIVLCAPWLSSTIFMTPPQMGVFRIAVAATFLQAGFLVALNLLLYFDLQLEAFASTFLFCLVNAVLTHASIGHGLPAFGYGYAGACFVGLALAVCFLNERITRLHYLTFMSQPIPRPQAAPAEEPA